MAAKTGNYFVTIFDEAKRYLGNLLQEGVPLVDGDWNDQSENEQKMVQRPFQKMGKRFAGVAFNVLGQTAGAYTGPNTFKLDSGGAALGDAETWAWGWIGGLPVRITNDWLYWPDPDGASFVAYTARQLDEMFHRSFSFANIGGTTYRLVDTSMAFIPGELVGRTLYPDLTDATGPGGSPAGYTITANGVNSIDFVSVPVPTASSGDHYGISLTTPGAPPRTDEVYLDCHIEEWNATEDPDLLMPIGPGIECMRRLKLVQCIHVIEDTATHGSMPSNYVDADGNQHYTVLLATLTRDGSGNIPDSAVVDDRDPHFGSGPEVAEARGDRPSLEERIYRTTDAGGSPVTDGVIKPDGTLNPDAVGVSIAHDDLSNMPDTATPPATAVADHDARYGDLTYTAGPTGATIAVDDESHRDAISRLDEAASIAALNRIIAWMNAS